MLLQRRSAAPAAGPARQRHHSQHATSRGLLVVKASRVGGSAAALAPPTAARRSSGARRPPLRVVAMTATLGKEAATAPAPPAEAAAAAAPAQAAQPQAKSHGYKDALLVQSFGWDSCQKGGTWYKTIMAQIGELKALTCTHLWLPPPSQSVSEQGYMPSQLYKLDTKYGTKAELVALNKALKEAGITPLADIVINHRCADEMVDGKWCSFRDDEPHPGRRIDWGPWAIAGGDKEYGGTGNPDTGDDYGPAPDLDHQNPDVRESLKDWLLWLRDEVGFGGWRLDFVKGYGANYVREYIDATVGQEAFCVGEYWVDMAWSGSELDANQDAARKRLCDWMDANQRSCCAFDFPTKGILQEALKKQQLWRLRDAKGKPPGLMGWWPTRAVTFIANHDTDSTQKHWPFPSERVGAGYAYILTHPGIPCVFTDHLFTWGSELRGTINALAAVRRRHGIVSDAKVAILAAEADLYVARVNDSVLLKLGSRYDMGALVPKESEGWKVAAWGKDFCVWEKLPAPYGGGGEPSSNGDGKK